MNANKNNVGLLIGQVTNPNYKGYVEITLTSPLNQNDIIRFESNNEVTSKLVKLYDKNLKLVNSTSSKAYIKIKEQVKKNTLVYKTFDYMLKLSEYKFLLSKMRPTYFYITVFLMFHTYLVFWLGILLNKCYSLHLTFLFIFPLLAIYIYFCDYHLIHVI